MFLWLKLFVLWKVDFPNLWKISQKNLAHVHEITCNTHTPTHTSTRLFFIFFFAVNGSVAVNSLSTDEETC